MRAESYLQKNDMCERKMRNKLEEVRRLEALADDISPHLSDVMVASTRDPQRGQSVWTRLLDARDELQNEVNALLDCRREVTEMLERLPPIEYDVLYQIYVLGKSAQKTADELHYTRQGVYKIKRRGLDLLQEILDS